MKRNAEYPLQNTGATQAYDNKQLNEIFRTKTLDFLTTNKVDVIGRKFNWIPARRGDPPRSESDMPPIKSLYNCTNVGVISDFPKTSGIINTEKFWVDGNYEDAKNAIYAAEDQFNPNVQFRPDYDFDLRYNRMAQQNQLQDNIADYFQEQEMQRTIENRIFLEEYGLTGAEVDEAMARMRVEGALEAIKNPKRKVISKKEAFERAIAEAREQKMEAAGGIGDMDIRRVPKQQTITELFGLPAPGRLPRTRIGSVTTETTDPRSVGILEKFRMTQPVDGNIKEEGDFDMGGAGAGAGAAAPLTEGNRVINKLRGRIGTLTQAIIDEETTKPEAIAALKALGKMPAPSMSKPKLSEALYKALGGK